jgi:hypothetical protein
MTDYKATPEQWANVQEFAAVATESCLLELRARVETLEAAAHKHIVETSANILALASRVEALEAVKRPASKVYEISKPLKLTPEQAQHVRDLLAPNSKPTPNSSQIGRSLVNRVALAISGIVYGLQRDEDAVNWASEARAAIREVAAWMREQQDGDLIAATMVEQEAGR